MMTKPVKIVNNLTGIEWQNGLLADVANCEKCVGVVTRIILFLLFLLKVLLWKKYCLLWWVQSIRFFGTTC